MYGQISWKMMMFLKFLHDLRDFEFIFSLGQVELSEFNQKSSPVTHLVCSVLSLSEEYDRRLRSISMVCKIIHAVQIVPVFLLFNLLSSPNIQ